MAEFKHPETTITFTFKVNPRELEELGNDAKTILKLPDSRPMPEAQPDGYVHVIGNSLTPVTKKLLELLAMNAYEDPSVAVRPK